jgi:hypothetical protein
MSSTRRIEHPCSANDTQGVAAAAAAAAAEQAAVEADAAADAQSPGVAVDAADAP